jgi:hypothetical protein
MLLTQRMEGSSRRRIFDFRSSIFDYLRCSAPIPCSRSGLLYPQSQIVNRKSTIDNCQGTLTLRDVKNEGTSGDVYENKGDGDKMSSEKHGFYTKMHSWREDQQASVGFLGRECISYTIRQDGRRPTVYGKQGETGGTGPRVSGAGASAEWFVARGYQHSQVHGRLSMMYEKQKGFGTY